MLCGAAAAELAPAVLVLCGAELDEPELHAAAVAITVAVAATAARRGQWSLDISSSLGRLQICYSNWLLRCARLRSYEE
jgi:hypothetical protein